MDTMKFCYAQNKEYRVFLSLLFKSRITRPVLTCLSKMTQCSSIYVLGELPSSRRKPQETAKILEALRKNYLRDGKAQ
jgi:hypothetical protein